VADYEGFDLIPWLEYLAAFDEFLLADDPEVKRRARLRMRSELDARLDEERAMLLLSVADAA
jgi:hypothetical protein